MNIRTAPERLPCVNTRSIVVLSADVKLAGGITGNLPIGSPPATFRDWR